MPREIKFRAWISKNNHPLFNDFQNKYIENWQDTTFVEYVNFVPDLDFITIEQFTGLQDKNGVDIYEGDIVSGVDGIDEPVEGDVIFHVEWGRYIVMPNLTLTGSLASRKLKIIGNIHQSEVIN